MSTKKLFEVTITQSKRFYIEADSLEEAQESDIISDEMNSGFGDADWQHDETNVNEVNPEQADFIREHHPKDILKEEE